MKPRPKQGPTERGPNARRPVSTAGHILGPDGPGSEASVIKPKWAWHHRVLLRLRDRLLKDREEQLAESVAQLEPYSMDLADRATDEFDHELALSELSAEQDALYEVVEAIGRIFDGSYGICELSGKPIPAARLRAIPWTRFTKDVEARLEASGVVENARLGQLRSVRKAGAR